MVWKICINPYSFHGNAKSNFDGYSAAKKQSPSNLVIFVMNASSKITTNISAIYNNCFTNLHLYTPHSMTP